MKKAAHHAKKRAREESDTPIRKVFTEEFEDLHNKGYELITRLPQFSNMKTSLYKNRNVAQGIQCEPKDASEVILDEET